MEENARAQGGGCRRVVLDDNALAIRVIVTPHAFRTVPVPGGCRPVDQLVVMSGVAVVHAFAGRCQRQVRQFGAGAAVVAERRSQLEQPGRGFSVAFAFDRALPLLDVLGNTLAPGQPALAQHHRKGLRVFLKGGPSADIALGCALNVSPVFAGNHDQLVARIEKVAGLQRRDGEIHDVLARTRATVGEVPPFLVVPGKPCLFHGPAE
ncbi:hypothetical protein D3C87_1510780 [compost metagenome]